MSSERWVSTVSRGNVSTWDGSHLPVLDSGCGSSPRISRQEADLLLSDLAQAGALLTGRRLREDGDSPRKECEARTFPGTGCWEPSSSGSSRRPGSSFCSQRPSSPYLCHLNVSFSSPFCSIVSYPLP